MKREGHTQKLAGAWPFTARCYTGESSTQVLVILRMQTQNESMQVSAMWHREGAKVRRVDVSEFQWVSTKHLAAARARS